MKKLLALLLLSPLVISESITLECVGNANLGGVATISQNTSSPGMAPITSNTYIPIDKNTSVSIIFTVDMEAEEGTIEVPSSIRPKFSKEYKTNFTELSISESQIKGKFKWNNFDKGKFSINRNTGMLDYKNANKTITANCSKLDVTKKKF